MQPSSAESPGTDMSRMLRRFGPLVAIAVIAAVIIGLVVSGGDDDEPDTGDVDAADSDSPDTGSDDAASDDADSSDDATSDDSSDAVSDDPDAVDTGSDSDRRPLRDGVIPISYAEEMGMDIDFGPRCDVERQTIATPDPFSVECMAPFEGDNGGATARGVTADSIDIVWWIAQDTDPILNYLTSAIVNDDTNADDIDTMENLIVMFETYYETYGRKVNLIPFEGSGASNDINAAIADAVTIAEDYDPFMVWGGPALTNAFAQELHSRDIACFSCVVGQTHEYFEENDGLAYGVGKSGEQLNIHVAEYIGKRLAGDPAIHAGDESLHDVERVFGRVWITTGEGSERANEQFESELDSYGVSLAASRNYELDPSTLQEASAAIIAAMKEAGVTSVIFSGDPIAPRELTQEATAQNYFPEWVVTGSVLVDTTAFARSYDQEQWANAFGVSNLSARVQRENGGIHSLYTWFHGEAPRADDNIGVISPTAQTFYSFLQLVGPDLTYEGFREAIFSGVPGTGESVTSPALSWGNEGFWPADLEPDYHGVDDTTEIWWDPDETGLDEIDTEGTGMWRFVDGGNRYFPGEWPETQPNVFTDEGTVTIYPERPPIEAYPDDYVPLPAGG